MNGASLLNGLRKVAPIFTIIGMLAAGVIWIETRYEPRADAAEKWSQVHEELTLLHLGQLETRRVILAREAFELRQEQTRRRLTGLEQMRLQQVDQEVVETDRRILDYRQRVKALGR